MAACTEYSTIIISNALVDTNLNGVYIPYTTDTFAGNVFTIWTKDGGNTNPRVRVAGNNFSYSGSFGSPGSGRWIVDDSVNEVAYLTSNNSFGSNDCPVGLLFTKSGFSSGGLPTLTIQGIRGSTFNFPIDVALNVSARHGSVANFLRLRNQGQI